MKSIMNLHSLMDSLFKSKYSCWGLTCRYIARDIS